MCVWWEISLIASFPHSIVSVPPSKREKGRSGVLVFRSELDKHHSANCTGRSWCKEVLAHYFIMDVPHVDIKLHCLSLPLLLCWDAPVSQSAGRAVRRCRHCQPPHGTGHSPCGAAPSPTPPPHMWQLHPGSDHHQTPREEYHVPCFTFKRCIDCISTSPIAMDLSCTTQDCKFA